MPKLFLLFSHKLTEDQEKEAKGKFDIEEFIYLPDDLQKIWSSVSAQGELNIKDLERIIDWMSENSDKDDFVLVQGEYGSTFFIIDFCFKHERVPIYATSERVYEEKKNSDNTITRKHLFKHVNFRKYVSFEEK